MNMRTSVIAAGIVGSLLISGLGLAAAGVEPPAQKRTLDKAQAVCPVTGDKIDKAVFADYEGKRVYFCCQACVPAFKAGSASIVARMEKAGIVLDKTPAADPAKKPAPETGSGHSHGGHRPGAKADSDPR